MVFTVHWPPTSTNHLFSFFWFFWLISFNIALASFQLLASTTHGWVFVIDYQLCHMLFTPPPPTRMPSHPIHPPNYRTTVSAFDMLSWLGLGLGLGLGLTSAIFHNISDFKVHLLPSKYNMAGLWHLKIWLTMTWSCLFSVTAVHNVTAKQRAHRF